MQTAESLTANFLKKLQSGVLPASNSLSSFRGEAIWVSDSTDSPCYLIPMLSFAYRQPQIIGKLILFCNAFEINNSDRKNYLVVSALEGVSPEVFLSFMRNISSTFSDVETIEDLVTYILQKYEDWGSLFGAFESNQELIGPLVGVLGELFLLKEFVQDYGSQAVDGWWGPTRHRHDFEFNNFSVEVKSSLDPLSTKITVHGLNQLSCESNRPLYLVIAKLPLDPNGWSLKAIISSLIDLGVPAWQLNEKLEKSGFTPEAIETLNNFKVNQPWFNCYLIDGSFPSIQTENLQEQVKSRISQLSYRLELSGIPIISERPTLREF